MGKFQQFVQSVQAGRQSKLHGIISGGKGEVDSQPSSAASTSRDVRKMNTVEKTELLGARPTVIDHSGWCGWLKSWCNRFMMKHINEVKLFPREHQLLIEDEKLGNRAAQYVAWRAVLLITGSLFFAFIVTIDALILAESVRSEEHRSNIMVRFAGERYQQFFEGLVSWTLFHKVTSLMASSLAVAFAILSAWYWPRLNVSKDMVRLSFLFSFVPAFGIAMITPYRHSVDFVGMQVQMCKDLLNGTQSMAEIIEVGNLGVTLADGFGIELPPDFCEEDPSLWGDRIIDWLESEGVLYSSETESCPRADVDINTLDAFANRTAMNATTVWSSLPLTSAGSCSHECANCSTTCKDHLVYLSGLVNVYGVEAVSMCELKGSSRDCQHCFSPNESLQCAWACRDVRMAAARLALTGSAAKLVNLCLDIEDVSDFQVLLKVGTETWFWELLVGSYYALGSAMTLVPLTFTLLLGAAKGAGIAKTVIPYSRLPGIVSFSAATFTFPFVAMVAVLFQNVMGTWLTCCGLVFMLMGFLGYMKPGYVGANTYESLQKYQSRAGTFTNACFFISFVCLAVAAGTSDALGTFRMMLERSGWSISDIDTKNLREQMVYWIIGMISSIFGKSMISTVFFGDTIITLMHTFHRGEDTDPFHIQWARMELLKDLGTAIGDNRGPIRIVLERLGRNVCCCLKSRSSAVVPREDAAADHKRTLEQLMNLLHSAGATSCQVPLKGEGGDQVVLNKRKEPVLEELAGNGGNVAEPAGAGTEPAGVASPQLATSDAEPGSGGTGQGTAADGDPTMFEAAVAAWAVRRLAWAQGHMRQAAEAMETAGGSVAESMLGAPAGAATKE